MQLYEFVKIQIVHIKLVNFIEYMLQINRAFFKKNCGILCNFLCKSQKEELWT